MTGGLYSFKYEGWRAGSEEKRTRRTATARKFIGNVVQIKTIQIAAVHTHGKRIIHHRFEMGETLNFQSENSRLNIYCAAVAVLTSVK